MQQARKSSILTCYSLHVSDYPLICQRSTPRGFHPPVFGDDLKHPHSSHLGSKFSPRAVHVIHAAVSMLLGQSRITLRGQTTTWMIDCGICRPQLNYYTRGRSPHICRTRRISHPPQWARVLVAGFGLLHSLPCCSSIDSVQPLYIRGLVALIGIKIESRRGFPERDKSIRLFITRNHLRNPSNRNFSISQGLPRFPCCALLIAFPP